MLVNTLLCGADPSGTRCSADAINGAAEFCRAEGLPFSAPFGGNYRIDKPINLRGVELDFRSVIKPTFDEVPQVVLGGSSQDGQYNPNQYLWAVTGPVATPVAANIRIIGAKGQIIQIGRTHFLQLWADTDTNELTDGSIAYSHFDLRHIDHIRLDSNKETRASHQQWINENTFKLRRCKTFTIDGTYTHNLNIIDGGAFENNGSVINIERGSNNFFQGIRFENGGKVRFGEQSRDNDIEYSWTSINPTRPDELIEQDLGIRNTVHSAKTSAVTTATVVSLSHKSVRPGYARPVGVGELVSEIGHRVTVPPYSTVFESDLIPFTSNTRISVKADGGGLGGFRCKLIGYDQSGSRIVSSVDADYESIGDGAGSFSLGQSHTPPVNNIRGVTIIPQPKGLEKAAFFKLSVRSGGEGLECTHFSVSLDSDSAWGTNRQVGAFPPASSPGIEILLPLYVRTILPSTSINAHSFKVVNKTWEGLKKSSPIMCSFGSEVVVPHCFNVQAKCVADNEVTIITTNMAHEPNIIPSGTWVHMVAPGTTQPMKTI